MAKNCENPVIFCVHRKKLRGVEANMLETLARWSADDTNIFVDYFGIRMLPMMINLDGEAINVYNDLFSLLQIPFEQEDLEEDMSQPQKRITHYQKMTTQRHQGAPVIEEGGTLHVQRFHVYPFEIKLSIGRNNLFLPVL